MSIDQDLLDEEGNYQDDYEEDEVVETAPTHQTNSTSQSTTKKKRNILLETYPETYAYEYTIAKEKCGLCCMYFAKETVNYKVPNKRILKLQSEWRERWKAKAILNETNQKIIRDSGKRFVNKNEADYDRAMIEPIGRRYQSSSFLYNNTIVCLFCSQLFKVIQDNKTAPSTPTTPSLSSPLPSSPSSRLGTPYSPKKEKHSPAIKSKEEIEYKLGDFSGPRLHLSYKLARTNLAINKIAYQSSVVDGKVATMANSPPFHSMSRTIREVDPWWEINLGMYYYLDSLSFYLAVGPRQKFSVYIMLLPSQTGFEDPFLESVLKKARLVKKVEIEPSNLARMQYIDWNFQPEEQKVKLIRVQIEGLNTLGIQAFQVLQGNKVILSKEEMEEDDLITDLDGMSITEPYDEDLHQYSFATIDPKVIKNSIKDMMSKEKKMFLIEKRIKKYIPYKPSKLDNQREIRELSSTMFSKYSTLEQWKKSVMSFFYLWRESDLQAFYRVVFKPCCELNASMNKGKAPLNEEELFTTSLLAHYPRADLFDVHQRIRQIIRWIQGRSGSKQLGTLSNSDSVLTVADNPDPVMNLLLKIFKKLDNHWKKLIKNESKLSENDKEKINTGIILPTALESRGCSWSQFIVIVSLLFSNSLMKIPQIAFHINDHHFLDGIEEDEGENTGGAKASLANLYSVSNSITPDDFLLGSSLEQPSFFSSTQTLQQDLNSSTFKPSQTFQSNLSSFIMSSTVKEPEPENLLTIIRKESGRIPQNTSFSQYKLSQLSRKIMMEEIQFPKKLTADFKLQAMKEKRASTSQSYFKPGNKNPLLLQQDSANNDFQSNLEDTLNSSIVISAENSTKNSPQNRVHLANERKKLIDSLKTPINSKKENGNFFGDDTSTQTLPSILSPKKELSRHNTFNSSILSSPPLTSNSNTSKTKPSPLKKSLTFKDDDESSVFSITSSIENDFEERNNSLKTIDFYRVCSLCELRLPRSSVEVRVMKKHVITLRKSWDPALVLRDMKSTDNVMTMYNLVHVCLFCAQFFDPDFPDGIAYPKRIPPPGKEKGDDTSTDPIRKVMKAIDSQRQCFNSTPFFDTRYLPKDGTI